MIARLNLAGRPFRNRTLPWAAAVVVSLVSLIALVLTLAEYRRVNAESELAGRRIAVFVKERDELQAEAEAIRESLPENDRRTLEAAHALVERKQFSWAQLFTDLESALPSGVRISSIAVRDVSRFGELTRADLDLTVVGRSSADVTGMINEMNRGGTFNAVPLTERRGEGRGESGAEWNLRVGYVQRSRRGGDATDGATSGAGPRAASDETSGRAGVRGRERS